VPSRDRLITQGHEGTVFEFSALGELLRAAVEGEGSSLIGAAVEVRLADERAAADDWHRAD
jgi:hypothetical protein